MAKYTIDSRDIEFNLFEQLQVQEDQSLGLGSEDYKGILLEHEKFIAQEIFPTREASDEEGVSWENGVVKVPACLQAPHKAYYENGWFSLGLPEEIGGTPVPESVHSACVSMIIGANTAWSMYPSLTKGALNVIRTVGSKEQIETYAPKLMQGQWGASMCLTEPGAGSDVGALRTHATPQDDGSYLLEGVKIFISSGENDLYENIVHLVLARTPDSAEGTKGISLFLVPKFHTDSGERNDVMCTKIEHKMGIHASATCELTFGTNKKCVGYLIGEEHRGMEAMFIMMNEERLMVGLQGESQGNLAYEMALGYAKERKQFGKDIIEHPDVRRMLLRMRAKGRGLRAITLYAGHLIDLERKGDEQAKSELGLFIPVCKSYCSDQGFLMASEAVQVLGGYGYCSEYGVEQFIRDTKIAAIYEGTNGIQAMDLVMRKILKDGGKAIGSVSRKILEDTKQLDDSFAEQKKMMLEVLSEGEKLLEQIGTWAKEKKITKILQHSVETQDFVSRLFTAWRLMKGAQLAQGKEGAFYQSKCEDFAVYCQTELIYNLSLSRAVRECTLDFMSLDI